MSPSPYKRGVAVWRCRLRELFVTSLGVLGVSAPTDPMLVHTSGGIISESRMSITECSSSTYIVALSATWSDGSGLRVNSMTAAVDVTVGRTRTGIRPR